MKRENKANKALIAKINDEINIQLSDEKVKRALIATTFKAFAGRKNADLLVKQAIMEAMINGYTFEDILKKRVYAIPFGDGYQLVQSIYDARLKAQKSGLSGKSAPKFTYKDKDKKQIESCTITVWREGGHPEGYSATVFFDEYYKKGSNGKPSMWDLKPHTMIAKVAEMHALRMAFPDVLERTYIEEEFNDNVVRVDTEDAPTMSKLEVKEDKAYEQDNNEDKTTKDIVGEEITAK